MSRRHTARSASALGDYDKDGRLDILINGRDAAPNRLYHNDGNWHFTEVAKKAGVLQPPAQRLRLLLLRLQQRWLARHPHHQPGAVGCRRRRAEEGLRAAQRRADQSRREPPLPQQRQRHFHRRHVSRRSFITQWERWARAWPMWITMATWISTSDVGDPQMSRLEPNRFFRNNGDGTFSDLTRYVGFARPGNKGHGVAFVDIDNDWRARYLRAARRPLSGRPCLQRLLSQPESQPEQLAGSRSARREEQSLRGRRAAHREGGRSAGLSRSQRQRGLRRPPTLTASISDLASRRKSIRSKSAGPAASNKSFTNLAVESDHLHSQRMRPIGKSSTDVLRAAFICVLASAVLLSLESARRPCVSFEDVTAPSGIEFVLLNAAHCRREAPD